MSLQLKATFLLLIFSTNMFNGFICTTGIDIKLHATDSKVIEISSYEGVSHHSGTCNHHKSKDYNGKHSNKQVVLLSVYAPEFSISFNRFNF